MTTLENCTTQKSTEKNIITVNATATKLSHHSHFAEFPFSLFLCIATYLFCVVELILGIYSCIMFLVFNFAYTLFIDSRETQRERQRERQREKQASCEEPDAGLDPNTPGSLPEPKADAQTLSHSGALYYVFFFLNKCIF